MARFPDDQSKSENKTSRGRVMGGKSIPSWAIEIGAKLLLGCEYADWIFLRGLFFRLMVFLTSLKYQTWDPRLKISPGEHVLRIFTSWKRKNNNINLEVQFCDHNTYFYLLIGTVNEMHLWSRFINVCYYEVSRFHSPFSIPFRHVNCQEVIYLRYFPVLN